MIVIHHQNNKLIDLVGCDFSINHKKNLSELMVALALEYPTEIIAWCEISYRELFNISEIETLFNRSNMLLSYSPITNFFSESIGYVEESPFIKINKSVRYPTWQMSSLVGAVNSSIFANIDGVLLRDSNFDYFLNSLAKLGMPKGFFCYSEPKLLKINSTKKLITASKFQLYKFVKQHYKTRWLFLLFLNEFFYKRKFSIFPLLYTLFYKSKRYFDVRTEKIKAIERNQNTTIDIIIPTIGRKKYLYDFLCDVRNQTLLPINVIIVEQNPMKYSVSELDFIQNETWPFHIEHIYIHKAGACNARNIALKNIKSEWVFLADDDIRIESIFLFEVFKKINKIHVKAVSIACMQENDKTYDDFIFQWNSFGSGCSIIKTDVIQKCKFDMGFEFGFGEDADFGMQIRNLGTDIVFIPSPIIRHIKAPIGGFRTKPTLLWDSEKISPKPSPTVMLFNLKHKTKVQLNGYKTILFFKYYRLQKIKNPIRYFFNFKKQWDKSLYWANQLKNN